MTNKQKTLLAKVKETLLEAEPWPREGNAHLIPTMTLNELREAYKDVMVELQTAPKNRWSWKLFLLYCLVGAIGFVVVGGSIVLLRK